MPQADAIALDANRGRRDPSGVHHGPAPGLHDDAVRRCDRRARTVGDVAARGQENAADEGSRGALDDAVVVDGHGLAGRRDRVAVGCGNDTALAVRDLSSGLQVDALAVASAANTAGICHGGRAAVGVNAVQARDSAAAAGGRAARRGVVHRAAGFQIEAGARGGGAAYHAVVRHGDRAAGAVNGVAGRVGELRAGDVLIQRGARQQRDPGAGDGARVGQRAADLIAAGQRPSRSGVHLDRGEVDELRAEAADLSGAGGGREFQRAGGGGADRIAAADRAGERRARIDDQAIGRARGEQHRVGSTGDAARVDQGVGAAGELNRDRTGDRNDAQIGNGIVVRSDRVRAGVSSRGDGFAGHLISPQPVSTSFASTRALSPDAGSAGRLFPRNEPLAATRRQVGRGIRYADEAVCRLIRACVLCPRRLQPGQPMCVTFAGAGSA